VFRRTPDGISILLVRAKNNPSLWIFPKGHIEDGETSEETAVRETREEAGVDGEVVGRRVGDPIEFHNGRELVRVEYFLIDARAESDDTDGREKRWFPLDDAMRVLSFQNAQTLLQEARSRLRATSARDRSW